MLGGASPSIFYGTSGLALQYAATAAPLLAGMVRNGAPWRRLVASPLYAVPVTIATGIGLSTLSGISSLFGMPFGEGLLAAGAGMAATAGIGYLAGRRFARTTSSDGGHRRGTVIREADSPVQGRKPIGRGGHSREAGITVAGVPIPELDETKHFKIIGTTGTGKSTAITEILEGALARGDRAVIADPDGGYAKRFFDPGRGDVILNPFESASRKWDLFGEIQTPYDVEQLARSLIPDHEGPDRSWRGYSRTFFTAVTRRAHEAGIDEVGELYRLLVMAEPKELRALVAGTAAQPFLEEHNSRMFDSLRSVTSSAVTALEYVGLQDQEKLSVRRWTQASSESGQKSSVLFIPYKAGQIAALRSQISAWMRLSMFEAMNQQTEKQRLWFVVDELDAVGQIDGLKDALARLRKFGGRGVLGLQSIAQVSGTYGNSEAHTIIENCANSLLLRSSASEGGGTARFASGLIGDREILRTVHSKSQRPQDLIGVKTTSQQISLEAAVLPSEIEQLPDLSGFLKIASRPEWLRVRLALDRHASHSRDRGADEYQRGEGRGGGYEL